MASNEIAKYTLAAFIVKKTAKNLCIDINILKPMGCHDAEVVYSHSQRGWYVAYKTLAGSQWAVMDQDLDTMKDLLKSAKAKLEGVLH